ncbi:MAG: hypothetical protein HKN12_09420 [Gemmatimonadetes bacterium]|nr:hypothetical protein [Gemmatimonadota bacterium]
MKWSPVISARTEAILRCFLPEVRNVEVDGTLAPSLRLGRETLIHDQIRREFSASALDQVYLALRLAIVETLGSSGERLPVFLDDPLTRADDAGHDRALEFLVEDASARGQVVFLTAHEVRTKWFLHQHPQHRDGLTPITDTAPVSASTRPATTPAASPDVVTADQRVIAPPEPVAPPASEPESVSPVDYAPPPPLPPR